MSEADPSKAMSATLDRPRTHSVVTPGRVSGKGGFRLRLVAAALFAGSAYWLARPTSPLVVDSQRFAFRSVSLPSPDARRTVRALHPDYEKINGWISSVGAAASIADLDNNGLPDEAVMVDPRSDRVLVVKLHSSTSPSDTPLPPTILAQLDPPTRIPSSAPMGTVIGDFDGDGWPDVLVYYWGRLPVIFRNKGISSLPGSAWDAIELSPKAFGGVERCFTNCATQADIDGDGRPDLVIGNYFSSRADVLNTAGQPGTQEMQSAMSRAENGGQNFILLNQSRGPGSIAFSLAEVALTDGKKPLAPAVAEQVMAGWTLAVAAGDLDGDLLPELYFANDFGPDRLLVNESTEGHVRFVLAEGRRGLVAPKSKTLGRDSFKGMGVDFANLDGSAEVILVSNIAERWALLESHFAYWPTLPREALGAELHRGVAAYKDRSEELGISRSGWGWDIKAEDFDNDGSSEIVQALGFLAGETDRWAELQELASGNDFSLSHLLLWPAFRHGQGSAKGVQPTAKLSGDSHLAFFARSGASGPFTDIGAALGFPSQTVSRGIALADIDHDGRMDFVLANQWGDSFLYLNQSPTTRGHFLGFRLGRVVGEEALRTDLRDEVTSPAQVLTPMIGARVSLRRNGRLLKTAFVDGGNGHSGHRAPEIHFGISDADAGAPLTVSVDWRWGGEVRHAEFTTDAAPTGDRRGWKTVLLHN